MHSVWPCRPAAAPRAGVGRRHLVQAGARRRARLFRWNRPACDLGDLREGGAHQERSRAFLLLDQTAELFGIHARCEDVGAAPLKDGERGHQGDDVKQWPAVEVHVAAIDVLELRHHEALEDAGGVGEQGAARPARECRGVDLEHGEARVDGLLGIGVGRRGQEGLVGIGAAAVVLEPERAAAGSFARLARGLADLLLLPEHQPGIAVGDHEGELVGALAPVGGTEGAPQLGGGEQALQHPVRVLAEPEDAVAALEAARAQALRQSIHARVHLGVAEPGIAADERRLPRVAAAVLAQQVAQGVGVEAVHPGDSSRPI
jgi:hypothetical protein